jgi:hypothetical protein
MPWPRVIKQVTILPLSSQPFCQSCHNNVIFMSLAAVFIVLSAKRFDGNLKVIKFLLFSTNCLSLFICAFRSHQQVPTILMAISPKKRRS